MFVGVVLVVAFCVCLCFWCSPFTLRLLAPLLVVIFVVIVFFIVAIAAYIKRQHVARLIGFMHATTNRQQGSQLATIGTEMSC